MARKTTKESKSTISASVKNAVKENTTTLVCKVTKIYKESDKFISFGIEAMTSTPNNKIMRAWLNAVYFEDEDIEEGKYYAIDGYFQSREYNGKWSNQFVVTNVDVIE